MKFLNFLTFNRYNVIDSIGFYVCAILLYKSMYLDLIIAFFAFPIVSIIVSDIVNNIERGKELKRNHHGNDCDGIMF